MNAPNLRVVEALGNLRPELTTWCNEHPAAAQRIATRVATLFPRLCPLELADVLDVRLTLASITGPARACEALGCAP